MASGAKSNFKGATRYQNQLKGRSNANTKTFGQAEASFSRRDNSNRTQNRLEGDEIDEKFRFFRYKEGGPRLGWLLNYLQTSMPDESGLEKSALDLYFIDRLGENFKATVFFAPYFYVDVVDNKSLLELSQHLQKRFEGCRIDVVEREDLDMPNHLNGNKHKLLKLIFGTVNDMMDAKNTLRTALMKRSKRSEASNALISDPLELVSDLREHDVNYTMRASIDSDIRVGNWFTVTPVPGSEVCEVVWERDYQERGEPKVLAFDIECEKSPLKFPNPDNDRVFMISYMADGKGYLIVNREIVSEDIADFEYTPMPKYPGEFHSINVPDEKALLQKFVQHVQELRPHVIVTYNGDFFDWPYVDKRCKMHGISLYTELGVRASGGVGASEGEYTGRTMVHLDAFSWVQRDSYLPQGNQGLKAVTRVKLGYDPVEVDPEDMLRFAQDRPHHMASYSVSDAVATYYLYNIYVHNFIFSLSTIIPMNAEDVLRKGSGTLCEALLMVEAYRGNILCPNKQVDQLESFYNGHLIESETYIGGHVECLEAGVFRADIKYKFNVVPSALQLLIDHIDRDLTFAIETEHGLQRSDIINYDVIKQQIVSALELLRDNPNRYEHPRIYHLDVGAMYPNIILTNRLQPSAMVSANDCAACDFNRAENQCKRHMTWAWRGDYSPAGYHEYQNIKTQLSYERHGEKMFSELSEKEQHQLIKSRLKKYSQSVYNKTKVTKTEERIKTVCMRENAFYVNTVRAFRDRRYDYKIWTKEWKAKRVAAEKAGDLLARKAAEDKEVLMESLQIAHKCILNSFYGYVMRKGARWRSMEMAGIVTNTGAQLIRQARELVEQIGRPLELDTDGIWCILPSSFPENFKFLTSSGKKVSLMYPCAMLNADVHERYTNHQYQDLTTQNKYSVHSECSIFFELDGPYKAMVLPASPEEGKLLKKKYVVFNYDNTVAELKGFELKRRGELELVKLFQSQVFEKFLAGSTLEDCYDAVGRVANQWLDILDNQGVDMEDSELLELISERKTISKTLDEYEGRKATSLTTAERLSDFLGAEMVKDKGLNCNLIISRLPAGAPVTDRAIPVAIFSADPAVRNYYLSKWLKDPSIDGSDFRTVVDWDYYKERLGKSISKIITVPAGMQHVQNPCPRVDLPVWVKRILQEKHSGLKQSSLLTMFKPLANKSLTEKRASDYPLSGEASGESNKRSLEVVDIEDIGGSSPSKGAVQGVAHVRGKGAASVESSATMPSLGSLPMKPTQEELIAWLESRKALWTSRRTHHSTAANRQYGRTTAAVLAGDAVETDVAARKKVMGVTDLVKHAQQSAAKGNWHIVEIQVTDVPGTMVVWAFTGASQLQRIQVTVPRIMYVNCQPNSKAEMTAKELGGKLVKKDLPHGNPCLNLYEIAIPEHKYIRNEKALGLFLCDPQVEGVYETKTPLVFRSVVRLGAVTSVIPGTASDAKGYKLRDLRMVSPESLSIEYLSPRAAVYRKIFVYYAVDQRRVGKAGYRTAMGMIGVFIQDQDNAQRSGNSIRAHVFLTQPMGVMADKPPLQRIYRRYCKTDTPAKFVSSTVSNMVDAQNRVNELLAQYERERRGPTIVIAQGNMENRQWRSALPLLQQFPLVCIPGNTFEDRLGFARYAHVPVGNLGKDAIMSTLDVAVARQLEHNRHVLWCSINQCPDIGGADNDVAQLWSDTLTEPHVSQPGAYRSICVELEIYGLSVASIMGSGMLDLEGLTVAPSSRGDYTGTAGSSSISYDGACAKTFSVLKAMVTRWIQKIHVNPDLYTDSLLLALYRYLCGSSGNLLYDPALHRIVYLLMTKLYERLVAEFRKLGAMIVYADFYRVVICTNRTDVGAAVEYLEYIVSAINGKELFQVLEITVKRQWEQLLWLDSENWEGVTLGGDAEAHPTEVSGEGADPMDVPPTSAPASTLVPNDEDASDDEAPYRQSSEYDFLDDISDAASVAPAEEEVPVEEPVDPLRNLLSGHWDLVAHLPKAAGVYFKHIMDSYLLWYRELSTEAATEMGIDESTADAAQKEELHERIIDGMRHLLQDRLSTQLLAIVEQLATQYHKYDESNEFSALVKVSDTGSTSVALRFVVYVMQVLSLDADLSTEVAALRRTLLTQINIKEFNRESEYRNPSASYMLRDVVCSYCNTCRDVDVLRDPLLTGKQEYEASLYYDENMQPRSLSAAERWVCSHCHNAYDLHTIEMRLIKDVEQLATSFLLQDFRCSKTHAVSTRLCTSVSDISAPLAMDIPQDVVIQKLKILRQVAEFHNFEWLLETIEQLLVSQ